MIGDSECACAQYSMLDPPYHKVRSWPLHHLSSESLASLILFRINYVGGEKSLVPTVLLMSYFDAVEAHSCVDPLMPNSFLSKTQLLMINQLQDVSTRRSLSTAQLTKTFGSLTVVFFSRKNLASMSYFGTIFRKISTRLCMCRFAQRRSPQNTPLPCSAQQG